MYIIYMGYTEEEKYWMVPMYGQPDTLFAKFLEYLESTVKTLVFDILICWKWLGISHKQVL